MSDPIIPTRIIPAGEALPAIVGPPQGDEPPPWRRPTPPRDDAPPPREAPREEAPPAPPQTEAPPVEAPREAPQPVEVIVRYEQDADLTPVEAAPSRWQRLTATLLTWRSLVAVALAMVPLPYYGHSITTAWATALAACRDDAGIGAAYTLAGAAVAIAALAALRARRWWGAPLLIVTVIGATGVLRWWDPVQLLTGVPWS